MAHRTRTALVFLLAFVFAVAALPLWRVGSPDGRGPTYISEVTRSALGISNDASKHELPVQRVSAGKTAGEPEVQDTSGTSHHSVKTVIAFVGLAIVLFGLGVLGAVLYVARSRARRSKEMLEMLPRVESVDSASRADLEDEDEDEDDVDFLDWRAEHDDASEADLIVLSESEGDMTEDLICFEEGKNEELESNPDPGFPAPSVNSNCVVIAPSDGLPLSITYEPVTPNSPNPWVLASVSESSSLLSVLIDDAAGSSAQDTPFATPISSPPSSPILELVRLDHESAATERRWTAIDLALVMQLRPGLGVGAEFVWMVRLMLGVWGWISMLLIR